MQKTLVASAFLLMLVLPAAADEYVVNGGFEQPFDVGWRETTSVLAGSDSFGRWDTLGQPSPGFAAHVYKYLGSYASLYQVIAVPDANLQLSFTGRLVIGGGTSISWPVASFWIRYADSTGAELGNTRICRSSQYSTWASSDTVHLIEVADTTGGWNVYSLDLRDELTTNLKGINADAVRRIVLDLFAYDSHSCGDGWAMVCADDISLATAGIEAERAPAMRPEMSARPNPFSRATTVRRAPSYSGGTGWRLYDATGKLVRSFPAAAAVTISGLGLAPGVYLLDGGGQNLRLVRAD